MSSMSYKEAAAVLRNPENNMSVVKFDGVPQVGLRPKYVRAVELAQEALENAARCDEIILELNAELKRCREALNAQGESLFLGGDLISRNALMEVIENAEWHHVNDNGELVSGATGNDDALFKTKDIFSAVRNAPAVEADWYNELREAFVNYVCSGVPNPAPYCKNRCPNCLDGRGWCKANGCKGFNPG